jgi:hypothetical protein
MQASDAASLLAELIEDIEAMREHDARLADFHQRARAVSALRALAKTEACRSASSRQAVAATRLFLETEIGRPRAPTYVDRDPVIWEIVRDHLASRLQALLALPAR